MFASESTATFNVGSGIHPAAGYFVMYPLDVECAHTAAVVCKLQSSRRMRR